MHIYLLSVTHQINHSTRHLQNVNEWLQISKHAFTAPAFKSSPSRQCALPPPCFVCGCRCPCAAPPVEQRVPSPCPHQRRCRALPRAGAPHGPMCTLRSGIPPVPPHALGHGLYAAGDAGGWCLAVPQQGHSSSPCSKASTWGQGLCHSLVID